MARSEKLICNRCKRQAGDVVGHAVSHARASEDVAMQVFSVKVYALAYSPAHQQGADSVEPERGVAVLDCRPELVFDCIDHVGRARKHMGPANPDRSRELQLVQASATETIGPTACSHFNCL